MRTLFAVLATVLLNSLCFASGPKDHMVEVWHDSVNLRSIPPKVMHMYGNGICINPSCTILVTAKHIQMLAGKAKLKVRDNSTEKVLSMPDVEKQSTMQVGKKTFSYDVNGDISFMYEKHPVHHKAGTSYSYRHYAGQKVVVVGYYKGKFASMRAIAIGADVPMAMDRSIVRENIILDVKLKQGFSGSGVFNEQGDLIGMAVNAGSIMIGGKYLDASLAIPVRTIALALEKLDPSAKLFADIPEFLPPTEIKQYAWEESDLPDDVSQVVPELSAVSVDIPNPVLKVRASAKKSSDAMVNIITKQCMVQGTRKPVCHELSVIGGQQTYRAIGKNDVPGEATSEMETPKQGAWIGTDWEDTLADVAENDWAFWGMVDGQYLFVSAWGAEQEHCSWDEYAHVKELFRRDLEPWHGYVDCVEKVLTDKDFNVRVVFTEFTMPEGLHTEWAQTALYYDWVQLKDEKSPSLLPVKERMASKTLNQKDPMFTEVSWTEYRKFRTKHRIDF